jgi:lysophospholipase L1-like esterase
MSYLRTEQGFVRAIQERPAWPVVISEGDSWFSYGDVIGQLDDPLDSGVPKDQRAWALLRLEKPADEVLSILSGSQRALLRKLFERTKRIDAVLFSGGGNDIIGPDLYPLLRDWEPGMEAKDAVAYSRFERRLRQIADCYRELLDLLADADKDAKVFANSYDYVVPANRGVKIFGLSIAGPWLLPALDRRGIPAAQHAAIVQLLIDAFCATVDLVAAEARGAGRLFRVETRGTLVNKSDWKDEIHPSRRGAIRVAKKFEDALRAQKVIR